jgi:hypothetical protein
VSSAWHGSGGGRGREDDKTTQERDGSDAGRHVQEYYDGLHLSAPKERCNDVIREKQVVSYLVGLIVMSHSLDEV